MSYKPNFCCQCGEKIERVDWNLLTSRRFCELCSTEFGIHEKIPLILIAAGVLFGLFGIGMYFRAPDKTLNVSPNQLVSVQNANKTETNRSILSSNSSDAPAQQPQIQTDNSALAKTDVLPVTQNPKAKNDETPTEDVYFCGAMTKKGTPCSRRVKGGGRCWQHAGQTAMLAQEKLRVRN